MKIKLRYPSRVGGILYPKDTTLTYVGSHDKYKYNTTSTIVPVKFPNTDKISFVSTSEINIVDD